MYGDGCFETLKSYDGSFLNWEAHIKRLQEGLAYLGIDLTMTSEGIKEEVRNLLEANEFNDKEVMVRIQFWREGGRGYSTECRKASRMIQVNLYQKSNRLLELVTAETRCIPSESLQRKFKLTNGLNYIKAAQEAGKYRKDDALMLTLNGLVSETTKANLFWIKDGVVYTPSEECDLLPGITRQIVTSLIQKMGCRIEVGKFKPELFYDAEAAFCTNSLIEIQKIRSVDDHIFREEHQIIKELLKSFQAYKEKSLI